MLLNNHSLMRLNGVKNHIKFILIKIGYCIADKYNHLKIRRKFDEVANVHFTSYTSTHEI